MTGEEVVFTSFLPLRSIARARAVQTCWLITNGRQIVDIKKSVRSSGAVNVVVEYQCHFSQRSSELLHA
jgi:hypothetical protein